MTIDAVVVRGVDLAVDFVDQRADDPAGSGAPVPLVWGHGLTSSMASEDDLGLFDWAAVRRVRPVVRYDARGHGDSDSSAAPETYAWSELALDQLELADALGIDRYVAGGASMGAATALHAAVVAPERVAGLLLTIPPTGWATRAAQVDRYRTIADLVLAGEHDLLIAGNAEVPPPDPFVDDPRWRERFVELLRTSDAERLARVFRGAATADLPSERDIARLEAPTLILAWTGDPGHPMTTAARLQELMPHAELAVATTPDGLAAWTGRVVSWLRSIG